MAPQAGVKALDIARVEHVRRCEPCAPRHDHAPAKDSYRTRAVRVRADDDLRASIARLARAQIIQIEPIHLAIDLQADPCGGSCREHPPPVSLPRLAPQDDASRRMP